MMERRAQTTITPDEVILHETIASLNLEISRLSQEKNRLDDIVSNHDANSGKYQEQQVVLSDILGHIKSKESLLASISKEVDIAVDKKMTTQKESEELEILVQKKKKYTADIVKIQNDMAVLQKSMEDFHNTHSINKKNAISELAVIQSRINTAESDFNDSINKIKDFHSKLGELITN